jgi:hypothetical protein
VGGDALGQSGLLLLLLLLLRRQAGQEARKAHQVVECVNVEPGKERILAQLVLNLADQLGTVVVKIATSPEGPRHSCPAGKLERAAYAEAGSHRYQLLDGDRTRDANPHGKLDVAFADPPEVSADCLRGKAHLSNQ